LPAKINGVPYKEKHSRSGETREENEVVWLCSLAANVKGGSRISLEGGRRWRRRPARAPLAGDAPVVLQRWGGVKQMQIDVVVPVVVSICSEMAPVWRNRSQTPTVASSFVHVGFGV
jgi:hypothetical protein